MTHGPRDKECRRRCLSPNISLVSNTQLSLSPLPLPSLPSRPSQPENGLTNDDESSRVLSRGVEHICLEAGCRVVVLNPVRLSTRIHNIAAHHYHGSFFLSLSFPPLIILHHQIVVPRLSSNRDGGLLSSPLLSFHRDPRPARIRLDAPLKDARSLLGTKDSLIYYAY